jgi:hypothetical protein
VLLEIGTLGLAWGLLAGGPVVPWAIVVLLAFVAFFRQTSSMLADRRPRPAEMQGRDWSTWQTHVALAWLMVAAGAGMWLAVGGPSAALSWAYGVAAVVGFVAQMVVGIQGRLLPLHAWYRAMTHLDGAPPSRSAHRLTDSRAMLGIFLLWLMGVPLLAAGLMGQWPVAIANAAGCLLAATLLQAWHMAHIVRNAEVGAAL